MNVPPRDPQLLKGTTAMLILAVIDDGELYGYEIAQRLRERSDGAFEPSEGSLYPALHRLEQQGWLKSEWIMTETGREAKAYGLSASGKKQLVKELDSWARLSSAIQLVVKEA